MARPRARRVLATLATAALLLSGPAAAASVRAAPTPSPSPLPAASSWVGGKKLISDRVLTDLAPGTPAPPYPKAASWLVADLGTRQILAGRRVHVPLAPASTMKIFTVLALAPKLSQRKIYVARDDDAAIDGTKVGLVPGSRYTVADLLHGLIMSSGNDCANALGNLTGGQQAATGLMQAEATALGAFDTVPRTTSGLDAAGQVSSAYDLALAGSAALDDPAIAKIMKTTAYRFPGAGRTLGSKRKRFQIQSHNRLLRTVPGATGVKNGYTIAARGSFVGSATRGGHSYIAVVMRAEGVAWQASRDLLEWAFANAGRATPVGTLVRPGELAAPVGPGTADSSLRAATGPTATADPAGGARPNALRAALPGDTGPTRPLADQLGGTLGLGAGGLLLVGAAMLVGARRRLFPARFGPPPPGRRRH